MKKSDRPRSKAMRKHKRKPNPLQTSNRIQTTWNALLTAGRDPTQELMRIADKAEDDRDFKTAAMVWKELKSYIDAKMKPINPAEEMQRSQHVASLEELQAIKEGILKGTVNLIDKDEAIEHEPNNKADDIL